MQILGRRLEEEKLFSVVQIVVEALDKSKSQFGNYQKKAADNKVLLIVGLSVRPQIFFLVAGQRNFPVSASVLIISYSLDQMETI